MPDQALEELKYALKHELGSRMRAAMGRVLQRQFSPKLLREQVIIELNDHPLGFSGTAEELKIYQGARDRTFERLFKELESLLERHFKDHTFYRR